MAKVTVRYIVDDVDEALKFYTGKLDFDVEMHPDPAFAMLTRGDLRLLICSPIGPEHRGGGSRPMPDGTKQSPGGWNRFAIEVDDLETTVERLRKQGAHFRNEIVSGVGGKQILLEDPAGNPIELFEYHKK